jgi:hypothetical protein
VEVKASVAEIQSASAERSTLLDAAQVENLTSRGRDVMALLAILPGVVTDGEGSDALGVFNAPGALSGTRGAFSGMNIDGVSGNTRSGDRLDTPLNMDAVASELTVGWGQWTELQTIDPSVLAKLQRQDLGIGLGQINAAINPLNVIPAMSFGGITSTIISNWNMSLFRNISARDRVKVQLRAEAYNVFNSTQFSKVDTTVRFDRQGNQVNGNFGRVTAARDPL